MEDAVIYPKRIALLQIGGEQWMGGAEYIRNLAIAIDRYRRTAQLPLELYLIRPQSRLEHSTEAPFDRVCSPSELRNLPRMKQLRCLLERRICGASPQLHHWLIRQRFDFVYPYFPGRRFRQRVTCANWIPDFQHRFLPQMFSKRDRLARDVAFQTVAMSSTPLVLSSASAATDYRRCYPFNRAPLSVLRFCTPVQQGWLRPDPEQVARSYGLNGRFFLISNQFWRHKNHLLVFKAVARLAQQGLRVSVACTGRLEDKRDPSFGDEIRTQLTALHIEKQVHLLGLIPRVDQIQLMRRATAVIQPSLFEGWSTVVEDARALGKVIALSDIAVHREQSPQGCVFFGPRDKETLAQVMASLWHKATETPNALSEEQAQQQNHERVLEYGRRFVALATSER